MKKKESNDDEEEGENRRRREHRRESLWSEGFFTHVHLGVADTPQTVELRQEAKEIRQNCCLDGERLR